MYKNEWQIEIEIRASASIEWTMQINFAIEIIRSTFLVNN